MFNIKCIFFVLSALCFICGTSQTLPENKVCYFSANGAWSGYTALRHEDGHTLDTCADLCETEPLCDRASFVMATSGSNPNRCNLLQATVGGTTVGTADRQRIECKTTGFIALPDTASLGNAFGDWCTGVGTTRTDAEKLYGQIHYWDLSSLSTIGGISAYVASTDKTTCDPPISNWDVSHITSTRNLFSGMTAFNQNLSGWNMGNVLDMRGMFQSCTNFNNNGDPGIDYWDVSSVTDMAFVFFNAPSFNQPLNNWDTSSVITMWGMFMDATSFDKPLHSWVTSSVTDMSFMFNDATSFNQPLNIWDTTSVVSMRYMFQGASDFNSNIDNLVSFSTTNLEYMFENAIAFNNAGQSITGWNTSRVTNMQYMFNGASSFNVPMINWDTSNVLNMRATFKNAVSFNQESVSYWDVSSVRDFSEMFYCFPNCVFDQTVNYWDISGAKARHDEGSMGTGDRLFYRMFQGQNQMSHLVTWEGDWIKGGPGSANEDVFRYASATLAINQNDCTFTGCSYYWGTNSPTGSPTATPTFGGYDLSQDQNYISPTIVNPTLTYMNTSSTYTFSDYNFSVSITEGSDKHNTTGWVQEVKFARCRTASDLTSYEPVTDACSDTIISPFSFENGQSVITKTIEWIYERENACNDIVWNPGDGNDASLTWYVSYNAAKNLTVDENNTQHYEYICIEREFTVSFNSELNAVATFESTEQLVDVVQDVRVISSKMNACPTAGEYELEYEVFMRLINDPSDGLTYYMPYAIKPADSQCHYDAGDTALTSFSTSRVKKLTNTEYMFTVNTGCRAISSGVCDAFQTCEGTSDPGTEKFSINVNFQRGADTEALMGLINIFITFEECVDKQQFETPTFQAEMDIWRKSNTANSGYELVDVTSGGTVSVNEDIFLVMYTTTDVYSGVKNTIINNYVDSATDGYRQEDSTECITCSDEGCYAKNAVGTFGEFARTHYASATTDREHVYRHIVPTGVKSSITVNMTSTLTNECMGTSGRRLKMSSRRLNEHDGVMTSKFTMNVLYRRGILFNVKYDDIIIHAVDITQFLKMCNTALKGNSVTCETVAKDDHERFMFVMSGTLPAIKNASHAIIHQNVFNSTLRLDKSKVISVNADVYKPYQYTRQPNQKLSTDAVVSISIAGTFCVICLVFLFCACFCNTNGYHKLR